VRAWHRETLERDDLCDPCFRFAGFWNSSCVERLGKSDLACRILADEYLWRDIVLMGFGEVITLDDCWGRSLLMLYSFRCLKREMEYCCLYLF